MDATFPPTDQVPNALLLLQTITILVLELIADKPIPAMPEIARYTNVLAAARLIELTPDAKWQVTSAWQGHDGTARLLGALSSLAV